MTELHSIWFRHCSVHSSLCWLAFAFSYIIPLSWGEIVNGLIARNFPNPSTDKPWHHQQIQIKVVLSAIAMNDFSVCSEYWNCCWERIVIYGSGIKDTWVREDIFKKMVWRVSDCSLMVFFWGVWNLGYRNLKSWQRSSFLQEDIY